MTMAPTRTAFVTQWYPPEPILTPAWITESLLARGHDVRVLTGVPNFPNGAVQPGYRASRASTEARDGVVVHRAPLYPSHDGSAVRRAANYLSWSAAATTVGAALLRGADVALVYSSPATAAVPAMLARQRYGTPYVLLVQDVWPDSVLSTGFVASPLARAGVTRLVGGFVDRTYELAAHVAVISPGMLDLLAERGVPRHKLSLVHNWVDEKVFLPVSPRPGVREHLVGPEAAAGLVLLYAGNHGAAQALEVLVQAMGRLPHQLPAHLVMIGGGIERDALRALAVDVAPGRVTFCDPVPAAQLPELMASADLLAVSLRDEALFRHTMPSKVQAGLACGRPLLVVAPGDAASVVRTSGAGWAVGPGDVDGVVAAVQDAARVGVGERERRGRAARAHYVDVMSESANADRLSKLLHTAAHGRGART